MRRARAKDDRDAKPCDTPVGLFSTLPSPMVCWCADDGTRMLHRWRSRTVPPLLTKPMASVRQLDHRGASQQLKSLNKARTQYVLERN